MKVILHSSLLASATIIPINLKKDQGERGTRKETLGQKIGMYPYVSVALPPYLSEFLCAQQKKHLKNEEE